MLEEIANIIRDNKNIIEKKEISPIIQYIQNNSFNESNRVFSDIGEDSAALKDGNTFILVTTDRIKTKFIENFPFGAGFSSILVGIDDIYACGGKPLAASIIISFVDDEKGQKMLEGICEGSRKFQIPIIRGHTNVHGKCYELSSTVVGEIKKEDYISAKNAQIGDHIILVVDTEGKVGKASDLFWDTTTFKDPEEISRKRKAMNVIASKHLATASKDISNGGIFGTILQLIKYSSVGADINVNRIEIPSKLKEKGYTLKKYICMYLTTSFVITAPNINCSQLIEIFKKHGLHAKVIGKIIDDKFLLKINDGKKSIDVLKF